jgi:hypothetical protein
MRTMGLRISTLKVLNGRRSPGLVLSTCPVSPHGKNRHRLRSAPGCPMWSWFRGCARCPRSMASPGSTRRSGKSCPLTVTTSARSRVRRRPGFRVRRQTVRESFLRFSEDRGAAWESQAAIMARGRVLAAGHDKWRADRRLVPGEWPSVRYVLLHTFAHALIRELALECGYSVSGIAERVYARSGASRWPTSCCTSRRPTARELSAGPSPWGAGTGSAG